MNIKPIIIAVIICIGMLSISLIVMAYSLSLIKPSQNIPMLEIVKDEKANGEKDIRQPYPGESALSKKVLKLESQLDKQAKELMDIRQSSDEKTKTSRYEKRMAEICSRPPQDLTNDFKCQCAGGFWNEPVLFGAGNCTFPPTK